MTVYTLLGWCITRHHDLCPHTPPEYPDIVCSCVCHQTPAEAAGNPAVPTQP